MEKVDDDDRRDAAVKVAAEMRALRRSGRPLLSSSLLLLFALSAWTEVMVLEATFLPMEGANASTEESKRGRSNTDSFMLIDDSSRSSSSSVARSAIEKMLCTLA
jgi:hypothetical protein